MKKKNIRMTVVIALLAITMISMEAHALTLTLVHPNGGEKFAPGDTVTISWIFSGDGADGYHNVVSVLSVDGGLNYNLPLFSKGYVYSGASGSTRWVVPNDGIYFSNQASIEIYEYSQKTTVNDQSDDAFVIEGKNIVPPIPRDSIKDTALVDGWSRMSGGAGGKVVYSDYNSIYVLDLRSGVRKKISSFEWTSSHKWSPDGKRICVQNNEELRVMNADGSSSKSIWKGSLEGDLVASGWDGNNAVVYSTCTKIVKTLLANDNSALETQNLYTKSPSVQGKCFSSVEKSGDYLCFLDMEANRGTGGYHRPCIYNVKTGALKELVSRKDDGCTLRLRPDSSGYSMYNFWNHYDPARIVDEQGKVVDSIPQVNRYGIGGMRWSNMPRFIIHNGDSDSRAWIRDITTKKSVYAGDRMYWPDLWVGPTSPVSAMSSHFQPLPAISLKLSTNSGLQILHSMHFSHGLEVPLFSMTGKKIAILTSSNNTITINTAQIPAGIYMVRFNADTKQIAIPLYIR